MFCNQVLLYNLLELLFRVVLRMFVFNIMYFDLSHLNISRMFFCALKEN